MVWAQGVSICAWTQGETELQKHHMLASALWNRTPVFPANQLLWIRRLQALKGPHRMALYRRGLSPLVHGPNLCPHWGDRHLLLRGTVRSVGDQVMMLTDDGQPKLHRVNSHGKKTRVGPVKTGIGNNVPGGKVSLHSCSCMQYTCMGSTEKGLNGPGSIA